MKKAQLLSVTFTVIGILIFVGAILFCLTFLNSAPILVSTPENALVCAQSLMEALDNADYETASAYLQGQPDLGLDRVPKEEVGKLLWDAFTQSFQYEFVGQCYTTPSGVTQMVMITTLDLQKLSSQLPAKMEQLLEEQLDNGGMMSQFYDAEGNFRQDLIQELLVQAATQLIADDPATVTRGISLNLVYQDDAWAVILDRSLLAAISGGIAG